MEKGCGRGCGEGWGRRCALPISPTHEDSYRHRDLELFGHESVHFVKYLF